METYYGKVTNGVLKITNRKQFDFELKQFEGKEISIEIKKKKRSRSNQQNKYLHGILIPCFKQALNEVGFNEVNTNGQVQV